MSFDKGTKYAQTQQGPTVSSKTAASIGLFGAMSIIIGSTVGVGIFFKNGNVFKNNDGNAIGILLSWILAFLIALAVAYSFGEIVTCKTKSANSGLAGWFERLVGYRSGRIVKILLPLVYYGVYMTVNAVFFAETIFNFINVTGDTGNSNFDIHIGFVILVAYAGIFLFSMFNMLFANVMKKASSVTTIMKFVPLLLIVFAGIICGCIVPTNTQNLFVHAQDGTVPFDILHPDEGTYKGKFDFTGVLDSLPAILFAFDSFLIVGNIAGEMKNPKKNVPLSIVLSMTAAGVVYLLVTIGQICVGCGSAYAVFDYIFTQLGVDWAKTFFHAIVTVFIFIAIFGVMNSFSMGSLRSFDSAIEEEIIVGSKWIKKVAKGRFLVAGAIALTFSQLFYFIILGIPSIVMNTDQIYDGISNAVVLVFFGIYSMLSVASIVNRYKNKAPEVTKQKGQIPIAAFAGFGCAFALGYGMIWQFLGKIIMDPNSSFTAWGLFHENATEFVGWQACMWFWIFLALFIVIPCINDGLIKLTDKNYNQAFFWQKQREEKTIEVKA